MHNIEGAGLNVKNRKSPYFNVGVSVWYHIWYDDPKMIPIVFGNDVMYNNEGAGLNMKNRKSQYFNVGVSVWFCLVC